MSLISYHSGPENSLYEERLTTRKPRESFPLNQTFPFCGNEVKLEISASPLILQLALCMGLNENG